MKRSRGERRGLPARGGQRLPDVVLRVPGGVAVPDREGKGGRPVPHRPVPARALSGQGARRADVTPGSFRAVKQVLADDSDAVEWLPLTVEVAERYEDVAYPDMKDPFDRIIVAAAWAAAVPLVTADRAISTSGSPVQVIW